TASGVRSLSTASSVARCCKLAGLWWPQRDSPDVDGLEIRREGRRQDRALVRATLLAEAAIPGRVEFAVQLRAEFQGLNNRSCVGQRGPHCVDRGSPSILAKRSCECCENRVLVALREFWSSRPPVRVAGLTRFPGPQIPETRCVWHQLREYDRITVSSVLRAQFSACR